MPFVENTDPGFRSDVAKPPAAAPEGDPLAAAFRQQNTVVSFFNHITNSGPFTPDPSHNPMDVIRGTPYEASHSDAFVGSRSDGETRSIMRRIDQEENDKRVLEANGVGGTLMQMLAGGLDPTMAMPSGMAIKAGKEGYSIGKAALSTGAAFGAQSVVQEAGLHATQVDRSLGESAFNVGSATILGALIGPLAAKLLTPAEHAAAVRAIDRERVAMDTHRTGSDVFGGVTAERPTPTAAPPLIPEATAQSASIGKNADGMKLYEDDKGRRYFVDDRGFKNVENPGSYIPGEEAGFIPAGRNPKFEVAAPSATVPAGQSANRVGETNTGFGSASMRTYREQLAEPKTAQSVEPVSVPPDFTLEKGEARPDGKQRYQLTGPDGPTHAVVDVIPLDGGKTLEVAWVGYDNALGAQIPLDLGATGGRNLLRQLQELYPEATKITGNRVSGAKRGEVEMALPEPAGPGVSGALSAAGADTRRVELVPYGLDQIPGVAGVVERTDPMLRTFGAESVTARRTIADLAETPLLMKENLEGIPTTAGPALDRIARMDIAQTRVAVADELDRLFSDYRFGNADTTYPRARAQIERLTGSDGGKMTFAEFKAQVSQALQEGDKHAIPQVQQAAQFVRGRVFEPWKQRAVDAGLFPEDMAAPKGAESYLQRVYNKQAIAAKRPDFVNKVTGWLSSDQASKAAAQERIAGLNRELQAVRNELEKANSPEGAVGAKARHDALMGRIEKEIAAWEGQSVREAKSAIKAREKYAAKAAREADAPRLTSADTAIDAAVKRIIESDRALSPQELRAQAGEITDRILGSPDGRLPYDIASGGPEIGHSGGGERPRGPLAERKFAIPDALIRDYLENDIEHIVNTHLRTMVPDVLLSERFGDVRMTEAFRKINDEYAALIEAAKSEKARTKLEKERQGVIRDIAAIRDRTRHLYGLAPEGPMRQAGRVIGAVKNFNVLTSMGMAAVSSIPDMAGAVFRHGLGSAFGDAWAPWLRSMMGQSTAWKEAKSQFRAMGISIETTLASRAHSLSDTMDSYRPQSRLERTLQYGADKFQLLNLLAPWTDWAKTSASLIAGSEILRAAKASAGGTATKRQIRALAESGIDATMAQRIHAAFQTGGEVRDGVHLPNTADWTDATARRAFEGAVGREADIAVITPGAEKPLWMSQPVLSVFGQFKSFTAAATTRLLIANLQRRDAQVLQGLITSLGMGMLSYKINSLTGGQPTSDRPQDWIKEAMSRSNVLGWFEEGNSIASKATRGGVDVYRLIGADKPSSRFVALSARDQLLGPTAGKVEAMLKVTSAAAARDWTHSDTTALRRLMIGQNLVWLRGVFNQVEASANDRFGVPNQTPKAR